ncbi:hypothetical protein J0S82_018106 [Galemys pyrenaicus]|uniref:RING-type domain-containing protein n=1 Tax=Galemys pyrenaicus TaxID=202257 RepID=A0A8J6AGK3_GALPY|nr:hypothetical protein J0S82_018106 [Galemys pyrenaicus]
MPAACCGQLWAGPPPAAPPGPECVGPERQEPAEAAVDGRAPDSDPLLGATASAGHPGREEAGTPGEECPICTEPYGPGTHRLTLLYCGHGVCGGCLQRLLGTAPSADLGRVRCPLCRQKTPVPEREICRLQEELLQADGPPCPPRPAPPAPQGRGRGPWACLEYRYQFRFLAGPLGDRGCLPFLPCPPCLGAHLWALRARVPVPGAWPCWACWAWSCWGCSSCCWTARAAEPTTRQQLHATTEAGAAGQGSAPGLGPRPGGSPKPDEHKPPQTKPAQGRRSHPDVSTAGHWEGSRGPAHCRGPGTRTAQATPGLPQPSLSARHGGPWQHGPRGGWAGRARPVDKGQCTAPRARAVRGGPCRACSPGRPRGWHSPLASGPSLGPSSGGARAGPTSDHCIWPWKCLSIHGFAQSCCPCSCWPSRRCPPPHPPGPLSHPGGLR